MPVRSPWIFVLPLLVLISACQDRYDLNTVESLPEPVKANVRDAVDNGYRPGISVALINQHGAHYFSYGRLSVDKHLDPQSLFAVGSLTKLFNASLFAERVLRGELKLETPVNALLPEGFRVPDVAGTTMTLRHLATHTAGLPRDFAGLEAHGDNAPTRFLEQVASFPYQTPFGQHYQYSNAGMTLLALLLERHSGQPFPQLIAERVTAPLAMADTGYQLSPAQQQALATPHHDMTPIAGAQLSTPTWRYGAGGLYSSTADLVRWLQAHLHPESSPMADVFALTMQPFPIADSEQQGTGLGWKIRWHQQQPIYYHGGEAVGYQAFVGFNPQSKLAVVLLSNAVAEDELQQVALHLLGTGLPLPDFSQPKPVSLAPEVLQRYVGTYLNDDDPQDNRMRFSIREGKLFYQELNQDGERIRETFVYAKSASEFYFKEIPVELRFMTADGNQPPRLQLQSNDQVYRYSRQP